MSQNRQSLDTVARDSGFADVLLRPLSARLLSPTKPEQEGRVDRERLFSFEGRSRKPQMELARSYGITSYVQPAGGCLLTDPAFSSRLRELLHADPDAGPDEMRLLRMGRHFRFPSGAKAVVGRDEKDNERIEAVVREDDVLFFTDPVPGPVVLLRGSRGQDDVELAARLGASYADHEEEAVELTFVFGRERGRMRARPKPRAEFKRWKIG
jgi:hypothetical protein